MSSSAALETRSRISALEAEPVLAKSLEAIQEIILRRLDGALGALVLGGSFGRGEGCFFLRNGRWMPGNNLNLFLILQRSIPADAIARLREDIEGCALAGSIELAALERRLLPSLPITAASFDLKHGHRTLAGDARALDLLPAYRAEKMPRLEAEGILRRRLATLLEAYPSGDNLNRSYYLASRVIFAGVDAFLIRQRRYAASFRDKAERFLASAGDPYLCRLVESSLCIQLGLEAEFDRRPAEFWRHAVRFTLDSLIGLFCRRSPYRPQRLELLLADFHYRSVSACETLRRLLLGCLGRGASGRLDRFLLALLIQADLESFNVDLGPLARAAGLPQAPSWEEHLAPAIEARRRLDLK